jgi:hypothetical protein
MHAGYRCRHAGVCCHEDWIVPVEAALYERLGRALAAGHLRPERSTEPYFSPTSAMTAAEPAVLSRVGGACAFFEPGRGGLCAIHRTFGHAALPSACQHFPRVVTIDPRGVFVSLSHVCPTAAASLHQPHAEPFAVVHGGDVVTPGMSWAGLDARDALPPQVNDRALWDWDALSAWERGVLARLRAGAPEAALCAIGDAARRVASWSTATGPLRDAVESAFDEAPGDAGFDVDVERLDALARASAVAAAREPAAPTGSNPPLDESSWTAVSRAVARYLAARTLANAVAYHASSALVLSRWLDTAYAVLRTEAGRHAAAAGRPLDAALLAAAAADADRLLVHRLDAAALSRALSGSAR